MTTTAASYDELRALDAEHVMQTYAANPSRSSAATARCCTTPMGAATSTSSAGSR